MAKGNFDPASCPNLWGSYVPISDTLQRRRVWAGAASQQPTSSRIAGLIEDAVLARGWVCGEAIASHEYIARTHHIGRSVIEESYRILQLRGVCQTKRGPGGGLVVAAPQQERVSLVLKMVIQRAGATLSDLLEACAAIDMAVIDLLASGPAVALPDMDLADDTDLGVHGRLVAHYQHRLGGAAATGNSALLLFADCLTRILGAILDHAPLGAVEAEMNRALSAYHAAWRQLMTPGPHAQQAVDEINACARLIDRLATCHAAMDQRLDCLVPMVADLPPPMPQSHAIRIARLIADDALARRLPPNSFIGTEDELAAEYGVDRMVIRQAIRLLQEFDIADVRCGRGNGLFSTLRPSQWPAVRMAQGFLASQHLAGDAWWEAIRSVQPPLVAAAENRASPRQRRALKRAVYGVRAGRFSLSSAMDREMFITRYINRVASSPILSIFSDVLIGYRQRAAVPLGGPLSKRHCAVFSARYLALILALVEAKGRSQTLMHEMLSLPLQPDFGDWVGWPFPGAVAA